MSRLDDCNGADPKKPPPPRPGTAESDRPAGWLVALNSFLERAFLEADRATGC